ncbi:conserved hypothetical protein [Verticillium alfalfae VaMs.102]|uniref:Peptidase M6-like domain-containing protein n=1 Tax=Verticillium alfalfae (strain VaMs.102 / ATCC MYA-4576 / FGSC 10136) TaxID=526221 RepID=C9SCI9_VERA1|nr:conserved hypothetical protein [Verticillium alfalfae VaMs.102]EEY16804.1 conserved hypothetical protein [Verticillium alfalfae VaMs.102]
MKTTAFARRSALPAVLALALRASAVPCTPPGDPFAVIDPQNWVNPDDMVWEDFTPPPGTNWSDPSQKGSIRNFNIALVPVDYRDLPFIITQPERSTIFGNPQPAAASFARKDVPAFYRDLLNKPTDLNNRHTLHEYWMEDSGGRFGVDLTVFGARVSCWPSLQPQYSHRRAERLRNDVGNETVDSYDLVFILSAGQDESSTWQEFGPMRWESPEDVPPEFGPPVDNATSNAARTRYVPWTSWAAAATLWPNAGAGSSTQGESSGMGVYAHELSHLLIIADNYNNPYSDPPQRAYTGPWSMMSRGSFNGPGGPHTRWQVPALQGAALGSLHTVRDKLQLGLTDENEVRILSRADLIASGASRRDITPARQPAAKLIGLRISSVRTAAIATPACNATANAVLRRRGHTITYEVEVVDRMGARLVPSRTRASCSPKTRRATACRSNGPLTPTRRTIRLRRLCSPRRHAARGGRAVVYGGVRATAAADSGRRGVEVGRGLVTDLRHNKPTEKGVTCSFEVTNTGEGADLFRLEAQVEGRGWRVAVPNELLVVEEGKVGIAKMAVGAVADAAGEGVVTLKVTSERGDAEAAGECRVTRA